MGDKRMINSIYTVDEMKARKRQLGLSVRYLSEISGVPIGTIQKILNGSTGQPRYGTMRKLTEAILQAAGDPVPQLEGPAAGAGLAGTAGAGDSGAGVVGAYAGAAVGAAGQALAFGAAAGPAGQGHAAGGRADYIIAPGGLNEEIDGVLYEMDSPTAKHQEIVGSLYYKVRSSLEAKKESDKLHTCMGPLAVQLDAEGKTVVRPDVMIFREDGENTLVESEDKVKFVPDFIAEVVSAKSKSRDMFTKLGKYREAGVREYWLVDPDKHTVMAYQFDKGDDVEIYTFTEKIPVGVTEGKCEVKLSEK